MTCVICKTGTYKSGKVTVKLERKGAIVLIKEVPADVCDTCGNYLLEQNITRKVLEIANERFDSGSELDIIRLAAA